MKNSIAIALVAVAAAGALGASLYAGVLDGVSRDKEPSNAPGDTRPVGTEGDWTDTPDQATSSPVQNGNQGPEVPASATPISVRGTMVCLPHKDTSGPQTMECAFGLKADDGRYYALSDTDPGYRNIAGAPMGVRVEVRGAFMARTSSNYQDIGIIYVAEVAKL
jgi:hypothetical protein